MFIADLNKCEARMVIEGTTTHHEARTENSPKAWEEAAEGVGIRRRRSALLHSCAQCGMWNVSEHYNDSINGTFLHGSFARKLTVGKAQACQGCGSFGRRLHSGRYSRIIAQVDAEKRKQVRNLTAVAEELNAKQDATGEPCDERDANVAWFAMNGLLKQGKGRKWWGMPFRRWRKTVEQGRCA